MKSIEYYTIDKDAITILDCEGQVLCECKYSYEAVALVKELNRLMNEKIKYKKDLNNLKYRISQLVK